MSLKESYKTFSSHCTRVHVDYLDFLYKEQLEQLHYYIFKNPSLHDIDLCRMWLRVFSTATNAEKLARNCLCCLMLRQLRQNGCFDEPFTEIENLNLNLENVLRKIEHVIEASKIPSMEDILKPSQLEQIAEIGDFVACENKKTDKTSNDVANKAASEKTNKTEATIKGKHPNIKQSLSSDKSTNRDIDSGISEFKRNIYTLRLEFTKLQIENLKLRHINNELTLENSKCAFAASFKAKILCSLCDVLQYLQDHKNLRVPLKLFEKIFLPFSNDQDFYEIVQACDKKLDEFLSEMFDSDLDIISENMADYLHNAYAKLKRKEHEKFAKRIDTFYWSQQNQMQMIKLKSFSLLRQIFLDCKIVGRRDMWETFEKLQEKYQSLL